MLARVEKPLIVLLTLLMVGCDDVVLLDVGTDGRVLAAPDETGQIPLVSDPKMPRHLCWVEPKTGAVERITKKAMHLSWPRVSKNGLLFVKGRNSLVLLSQGKERVLLLSQTNLFQPVESPDGERVLVLEAKRLGVPGRMLVLRTADGSIERTFERALIGACWTPDGGILLPRSAKASRKAFDNGPGEILFVKGENQRVLFRGIVPAATVLSPGANKRIVAALPLEKGEDAFGLAELSADRRGARRGKVGVFDYWPQVSADKSRVLFTRSSTEKPNLRAQLRVASFDSLGSSSAIPTTEPVAAPRWVGRDRVAFVTKQNHLVIQDLDGANRLDLTLALRDSYSLEEPK